MVKVHLFLKGFTGADMLSRQKKGAQRLTAYMLLSGVSLAVLTACGGGGGDSSASIGAPSEERIVMDSGASLSVTGVVSTSDNLLSSVAWSVAKLDPAAPDLTLSNENCAVVVKSDNKFNPIGAEATRRTGESRWSCDLGVIAPAGFVKEYAYRLILTGIDDKGNSHLTTKTLTVNMDNSPTAVSPTFTVTAGAPTQSVASGSPISRYCLPSPFSPAIMDTIRSFYWVPLNDAARNLDIDWLSTGFSGTNRLQFTAPVLPSESETLRLQCVAVKTNGDSVLSAPVDITVLPVTDDSAAVVPKVSLTFPSSQIVKTAPGVSLDVSANATWTLGSDVLPSAPAGILYDWSVTSVRSVLSGTPSGVSAYELLENDLSVKLLPPAGVLRPEIATLELTVVKDDNADGVIDAGDTVLGKKSLDIMVDPYGPLSITVSPPSVVAPAGASLSFTANLSSGSDAGDAPGYYRWTIFSSDNGTIDLVSSGIVSSNLLGGATTPTVGLVVPAAAVGKYLILRVEVSYTPFTVDYVQEDSFDVGTSETQIYSERAVIFVTP